MSTDNVLKKNAETVQAFAQAQNDVDRGAIAALVTEDATFYPGAKDVEFEGREAFLDGLLGWLTKYESLQFTILNEFYTEDEAFDEWRFVGRTKDGQDQEIHGVDYFKLRDGKIVVKSSFRKA